MATPSENYTDHLIVGDTKQSIYRWRNGDWNILHRQVKADTGADRILERAWQRITEYGEHYLL